MGFGFRFAFRDQGFGAQGSLLLGLRNVTSAPGFRVTVTKGLIENHPALVAMTRSIHLADYVPRRSFRYLGLGCTVVGLRVSGYGGVSK